MTARMARRVAGVSLGVFGVSMILYVILGWLNGNIQRTPADDLPLSFAFAAFMFVGALIVARRPGNCVGWIFSAIGLLSWTGILASEYAEYAYVTRPGSLPLPILAAWYQSWFWYPLLGLVLNFTLLFFPTGRLPSPRWRVIAGLSGLGLMGVAVLAMVNPVLELQEETFSVANPIGVAAVGAIEESTAGSVLFGLLFVTVLASFASLVVRFRRSKGEERQQLKWFTYSGALVVLLPLSDFVPLPSFSNILFDSIVAFLPISTGIAILKYRLYDIDRIINRTLVYGALTGLLGLAYAGIVVLLQGIFSPITEDQSYAVVGSTLAVAALFRPARGRIQGFIDRSFYRGRYDATRTLESFSERLQDEIDLDALSGELVGVVNTTMRPTHVSLWLRSPQEMR